MKAFHFLRDDMTAGSGNEPAWKIGETRTFKGKPKLCSCGYHSSPSWYDALNYTQGNVACIVEVSEPVEKDDTKFVSKSRKLVDARDAEKTLRDFACDCAERALRQAKSKKRRSWNAIKVARLYNEGKATKEELAAASVAARAAASDAASVAPWVVASDPAWIVAKAVSSAASDAASDAARAAARAAASVAASDAASDAASVAASVAAWVVASDAASVAPWVVASDAASVAASVAPWDAASDAASVAARAAEVEWQRRRLDELMNELFSQDDHSQELDVAITIRKRTPGCVGYGDIIFEGSLAELIGRVENEPDK